MLTYWESTQKLSKIQGQIILLSEENSDYKKERNIAQFLCVNEKEFICFFQMLKNIAFQEFKTAIFFINCTTLRNIVFIKYKCHWLSELFLHVHVLTNINILVYGINLSLRML